MIMSQSSCLYEFVLLPVSTQEELILLLQLHSSSEVQWHGLQSIRIPLNDKGGQLKALLHVTADP